MNDFIVQLVEHLKYVGVFVGALIEGPATALAAGLFVKSESLVWIPAVIAHFLGDFSADMFYFATGRLGSKKILKWLEKLFHFSDQDVAATKQRFSRHHLKIIFVGKLTHFLGLPAIIGIGLSDYSWKKFFMFNLIATIIKSTLLLSLGYSVGTLWQRQESLISKIGLATLLIAVLLAIYYLLKKKINGQKI